jgi:hypothetical protein
MRWGNTFFCGFVFEGIGNCGFQTGGVPRIHYVTCVYDDEWRGCASTFWTDGLTQLIC